MADKQINAILSLTDRMSAPLLKVSNNIDKVSNASKLSVAKINKMGQSFEKSIDGAIASTFKWTKRIAAIGGGLFVKVGIDGLNELEEGAAKVKSIARDALDTKDIQAGLLRMSTKLGGGITPQEIAEAQYQAISSGIKEELSLDFTEVAGKLKVAGFTDITSSIDILTSTMNAFNLTTLEDANRLADEFLYTQNKGVITVDEMSQYYGKLIPMFSSFKLGTKDMNVAIATITKMGMKPAEAVTSVAGAMRILSGQSSTATKKAKELGITLGAKELQNVGFAGKMQEIVEKTGGDLDKIMSIFPNARALLAGLNLTSEEGIKIFQDVAKGFDESVGLLDEAFETMSSTIPYRFKSITQTLKNYATEFFTDDRFRLPLLDKLTELDEYLKSDQGREAILNFFDKVYDAIERFIEIVKRAFDFLKENKSGIIDWIKMLGTLYLSIKAFRGISKIAQGFSFISSLFSGVLGGAIKLGAFGKFAAIIGLIALAVKHLRDNWEEYSERFPLVFEKLNKGIEWFEEKFGGLPGFLKFVIEVIINMIKPIKDLIVGFIEPIFNLVFGIIELGLWLWEKIKAFGRLMMAWGESDWDGVWQSVYDIFGDKVDWIRQKWDDLKAFFDQPREAIVSMLTGKFIEAAEKVIETWEKVKTKLSGKVEAVVDWKENIKSKGNGSFVKGAFYNANPQFAPPRAKGDNNWRGGLVQVSEKGGEILDLPSGTRIYPHDKSVEMAYQDGAGGSGAISLDINIYGNVYGEEDLMTRVGNGIVKELKENLPNMA